MIKFKTGDRVRIADDVPEVITDSTIGGNRTGWYTDHTHVPTNRIGTVLEDDNFPYVQWDDWRKWAVHQDTLELVQD